MLEMDVKLYPRGEGTGAILARISIVNTNTPATTFRRVTDDYLVTITEKDVMTKMPTRHQTGCVRAWDRSRNVLELVGAAIAACGYDCDAA